jgi:glycosyltransferase involved in cell wall biosynthesis
MRLATEAAPRVCMLVANEITYDSRVQKMALSAAEAGYDVLVIGKSPTRSIDHGSIGAAKVIRVPLVGAFGSVLSRLPVRSPTWAAATAGKIDRGVSVTRRRAAASARPPQDRDAPRWRRVAWRVLVRDGDWRRTQPQLRDLDRAFAPHIDAFAPDLIHAHDVSTLGVAVRAKDRVPRPVRVVYDAHELVSGVQAPNLQWRMAYLGHEAEYVPKVDAIVTVSDAIAGRLTDAYRPAVPVMVVANAPPRHAETDGPVPRLRTVVGLDEKIPLLVYSGSVSRRRGVATAVRALSCLPGVHLAVVCSRPEDPPPDIMAAVRECGVANRVHFTGYVAPEQVPRFLSSASVGVIPIEHAPNHELSLITKYYEYMHARLPIVVSDVDAMAARTRQLGNGEVFPAGDPVALAKAVQAVLDDPARYTAGYTDELLDSESWETHVDGLLRLYARLTDR